MKKLNPCTMVASLGFVLALVSCSGGTNSPSDGESTVTSQSDGKTHITFWHTMGKQNQDLLKSMIANFEKENPDIEVNETAVTGSYDDLQSLILNNVATGNLPTMAFCYPDNVAEYLDRNCVVDMSSYVSDAEIGFKESDGKSVASDGSLRIGVDDYVKAFWREGTEYESKGVYSVPFAKSTEALFYNKTVFDEHGWTVPTTWDEMWELCKMIREAYPETEDGDYKVYPLGYDSDSNLFITMCQQRGLDYTTNDLASHDSHFIFNNSGVKTMLNELKGYYDQKLFKTKGTTANATYTSTKFTAGQIFMSIGSTGGTSYQSTTNFDVGVATPPSEDTNEPAVISQGPSICFFNRSTEAEKRAAWKFYRHISNSTNSVIYGLSTGYQPVRYSSYETTAYKSFIEDAEDGNLFASVANLSSTLFDSYFTSPVFVGSAKARTEVGSALSSVLLGKDVDVALDTAMSNCVNSTRA